MQVFKLDHLSLFAPDPSLPSFTLFFEVGVSLNPELTNLYRLAGQKALWLCLALPGSAWLRLPSAGLQRCDTTPSWGSEFS